ncbi:glycosyl transferase family 39 [Desulfovibrio sp. X2]|nr:glycosyl transferase family 39 [Desulfovibrio sp. X2]
MAAGPRSDNFFVRNADLLALLIILVSVGVRWVIVATGQLNLVQDEAQYWDWTRHLQWSYYSKGPLIAWIIAFFTRIFGNTELGVRAGALLGSGLLQAVIYLWLAKLWKRPGLGLLTLFVANTAPMFLASGVLMTTDNPLLVCWTAAMFCLDAGTREDVGPRARGAAVLALVPLVAIGILAKYMMLVFPVLALAYAWWLKGRGELPEGTWPRLVLALLAGTVVGMLPILVWNAQHHFVGFKHVGTLAGVEGNTAKRLLRFDRFPDYLGSQVGLMSPWWFVFMLVGGVAAARQAFWGKKGLLGLSMRQAALLAIFFWPAWGFFILWSFHTKIQPNWSAVSYAAGFLLTALAFARYWQGQGRLRKLWAVMAALVFVLVASAPVLPIPRHLNPANRLKGWDDLGEEVARLEKADFPDPSRVFIFSEQYDMTAALAFYVPGQPRVYNAWLSRRMNQYDLWPGPEDKKGWDAVYVRKDFKDGVEPGVERMFEHISPPIHYQTTFDGEPARKFTIFLCRGFTGYWPREYGDF